MSEGLKPCPFCGSDWYWNWSEIPRQQVYARCNGDDCDFAVYGNDQRQVIDRINRRTPGPATVRMIEHIKMLGDRDPNDLVFRHVAMNIQDDAAAFIAEHEPAKAES